jgi:hypothetical protein
VQATLPAYSGVKGATGGRYRGDSATGATEVLLLQDYCKKWSARRIHSAVSAADKSMPVVRIQSAARHSWSVVIAMPGETMHCEPGRLLLTCSRRAPPCSTGPTRQSEHASATARWRDFSQCLRPNDPQLLGVYAFSCGIHRHLIKTHNRNSRSRCVPAGRCFSCL